MEETQSGLLFSRVDIDSCDGCGLCLRGCGGVHLAPGLLLDNLDPFKGEVLMAYCGYSNDPDLRLQGQSGGVATALLAFLLESGRVDQALVNRMPEDGSLRPEPFLSQSKRELLQSQGSKYCPVPLDAAIPRDIGKNNKKLAVVGLPCHLHSLRNIQQFNKHWKDGIGVAIGLFCDRTLAYGAIDYLIWKGGCSLLNVLSFRYKDKSQGEVPGPIYISTKDNKVVQLPSRERIAIKDYFTPPRCQLCFDKMNVLCDIAVGDAWGINEDRAGFSALLARTELGANLLVEAQKAGYLSLVTVDHEKVFKGQDVEARRRKWTAFTNMRLKYKGAVPSFLIKKQYFSEDTSASQKNAMKQYFWSNKILLNKEKKEIVKLVKKRLFLAKIKRKIKKIIS